MFISVKLITEYKDYIVEALIVHYVQKILFFLNKKYVRDTYLYKEIYKITHTKIDKFINIFYYFSIFYLCCKAFLILEFGTNNFKDEITEQVMAFFIRNIFWELIIQSMYFYLLIVIEYILKASYYLFIHFYPLYKKRHKKILYLTIIFIETILNKIPNIYIYILAFFLLIFAITIFSAGMVNLIHGPYFLSTH